MVRSIIQLRKPKMSYPWTRTLDVETATPIDGVIKGIIPAWLEGSLVRNGSGIYKIGETRFNHFFDGLSVIHKFSIKDGKVTYMNKALKSEAYKKDMGANRIVVSEYGTKGFPDPCLTLFGRFMNRFSIPNAGEVTDNCSVNLCYHGDALYAMTETKLLRRVDAASLETIGEIVDVGKYVAVHHTTAHPHVSQDGTVYNMANIHGSNPSYNFVEFNPSSGGEFPKGRIVASIPIDNKFKRSYFHSFGITENYFVFAEISLIFDALTFLASNFTQTAISNAFKWNPNSMSKFHLVHRITGNRSVFLTEPFFTFHHINAYEEEGHVVVDLCGSADGRIMNMLTLKNIDPNANEARPKIPAVKPRRYVLPINTESKNVDENLVTLKNTTASAVKNQKGGIVCYFEELFDVISELPRINYNYNGKSYRYFYSISSPEGTIDPSKTKIMMIFAGVAPVTFAAPVTEDPVDDLERQAFISTGPMMEDNGNDLEGQVISLDAHVMEDQVIPFEGQTVAFAAPVMEDRVDDLEGHASSLSLGLGGLGPQAAFYPAGGYPYRPSYYGGAYPGMGVGYPSIGYGYPSYPTYGGPSTYFQKNLIG